MKKILFIAVSAFLLSTPTAFAATYDACKNPTTPYDQTYCTAKLFLQSDTELNQTYTDLMKLVVDKDTKESLIKAQRSWIQYRNTNCSEGGTIDVQCNFDVNKARTVFLQDRVRECKIGHCDDKMIVNTDFGKNN